MNSIKLSELKSIINECITEVLNDEDSGAWPNSSPYGKHNAYEGEFSDDYQKLHKLERGINNLPRKISNKSVSANFSDTSKPYTPKNPLVIIVFQSGSSTRKIYMTLKEFNKNNDKFIFVREGTKKGKPFEIPIYQNKEVTTEELLKEILNWMKT